MRDRILLKYNEKDGLHILAKKLPREYLERWHDEVLEYKRWNRNMDPDLAVFSEFLGWMYRRVADSFLRPLHEPKSTSAPKRVLATKAEATGDSGSAHPQISPARLEGAKAGGAAGPKRPYPKRSLPHPDGFCYLHKCSGHWLSACPQILEADAAKKKELLLSVYACLRCTYIHPTYRCEIKVTCDRCKGRHLTILHDLHGDEIPDPSRH